MQTIAEIHDLQKAQRQLARDKTLAAKQERTLTDRRFTKPEHEQFSRALIMRAMLEC